MPKVSDTCNHRGPGKLTISRRQSNREDDYIVIEIVDDSSSTSFVEVKVSLKEFANVITSMAYCPCEIELRGAHLVGKKMECKHELLPRAKLYRADPESEAEAASLIEPYEVDGWRATIDDLYNHHRHFGRDKVKVGFRRYVDAETGEPVT